MLIGYARVSTDEQDTAAQVAALKAAGCERIYREKASGGRWDRPELHRLLDQLRNGDVLAVWKLDRLSRSLRDVLTIMEKLGEAKAGFRSLTEAIDTTTPAGRMMMQMVGAFAEFERSMLKERTKARLDAAREEGRIGSRHQTEIGCHTFRATDITAYLKNGGKLEIAQQMAAHESSRTTGLYDRRGDEVSLDEVERIGI